MHKIALYLIILFYTGSLIGLVFNFKILFKYLKDKTRVYLKCKNKYIIASPMYICMSPSLSYIFHYTYAINLTLTYNTNKIDRQFIKYNTI